MYWCHWRIEFFCLIWTSFILLPWSNINATTEKSSEMKRAKNLLSHQKNTYSWERWKWFLTNHLIKCKSKYFYLLELILLLNYCIIFKKRRLMSYQEQRNCVYGTAFQCFILCYSKWSKQMQSCSHLSSMIKMADLLVHRCMFINYHQNVISVPSFLLLD